MPLSDRIRHPFEFIGPHREALKVTFGALEFESVMMRAFPLRANLNRLTTFCNRYLHCNSEVPQEIAHFEPAAPYVLMMIINYGRMADTVSNMGWVAQNEILFGVPLLGRWNEDGKIVKGPAVVTPFIFVDNEWSMATGREVYGWPKMPVWLEPGLNPWLSDPRARRQLLTLKTLTMAELYQGQRSEAQTLLEVEQEPHQVFGQVPPNLGYLMQPLLQLPKMVADTLGAAPDFLQSLNRVFRAGMGSDLPSLISGMFKGFMGSGPNLYGDTINLKQFRASDPGAVCYQALVNSRMQIKRFNGGGLMGSVDLLRGDPSAGFSIFVHRLPAYPIIDSLGIEVETDHVRQGVPVAELKPLLPFWASLDMRYERGRRICWRGYDTPWRAWNFHEKSKPKRETAAGDAAPPDTAPLTPSTFNTTLGPVVEAPQGPFDFYDVTVRVLPLRVAEVRPTDEDGDEDESAKTALEKLLPDLSSVSIDGERPFENSPAKIYRLPGSEPYVFLVVTSYGEMSSTTNDIGWWAANEVSILNIVEFDTVPFLNWLYAFSDSPLAVIKGREVLGLPTAYAKITQGVDPWLEPSGAGLDRQLMTLSTMDYPAAGVGQQALEQRLIEVNRSDEPFAQKRSSLLERFKKDFAKYQKRGVKLQNLTLKEFRDEERPEKPCYQALVHFARELGELAEARTGGRRENIQLEALPGKYTVTFKSTPSWPIAETLGLVHRSIRSETGSPVAVCEVVEPFMIRTNIRAHLSEALLTHRIDSENWVETDDLQIVADIASFFTTEFEDRKGLLFDVLGELTAITQPARGKKPKKKTRKGSRSTRKMDGHTA